MAKEKTLTWDKKSKLKVLTDYRGQGYPKEVMLDPRQLDPTRKYLKVGDYNCDELSGWINLDLLNILVVLEDRSEDLVIDHKKEREKATPRKFLFNFLKP